MRNLIIRASAAGFYVLLGLMSLGALKLKRDAARIMDGLRIEMAEEQEQGQVGWTWVVDTEGQGGLPLFIPTDMAVEAIDALNAETSEQLRDLRAQQWQWEVTPMDMRLAMSIAQREPNLDLALFEWAAQLELPEEMET